MGLGYFFWDNALVPVRAILLWKAGQQLDFGGWKAWGAEQLAALCWLPALLLFPGPVMNVSL
jgi:hypothetical protein